LLLDSSSSGDWGLLEAIVHASMLHRLHLFKHLLQP